MADEQFIEMAEGSPDTRPCFYKIIWFANTIDLRIPPDFNHHLPLETEKATLRTPSGSWEVSVVRKNGNVFLDRGWQDFVRHHSLGKAEFSVFKYNGDMSFDVVIFDRNGSTRNTPPLPPPLPRSSEVTSSRPFFTHVIKKYNIGTSSILTVPKKFQRSYLPLLTQTIMLRDAKGISWPVNTTILYGKYIAMCGGWKAFADGNSIELGDVCMFELVQQESMMEVHIFRHN